MISFAPLAPVAAIIVMAASPVPPLVPGKELSVGGRREYAYGEPRVSAGILLFVLVGLIAGIPYIRWMKRNSARMTAHGRALPG